MDTLVSTDWLRRHLHDPDLVVLDCTVYQQPEQGGGFHNISGRAAYEKGHIPGAINSSALDLLDESGRFRPDGELAEIVQGDRNARTITYCGGGIMASASAFAMTRLGFKNVAVYTASLQEWAADPANPMVVGREQ